MSEQFGQDETVFAENGFGTVTNKRVIYFREKTWFKGGSREDIPLQHVTSVRLDTKRNIFGGIFLLLVGLGLLSSGDGTGMIFGIVVTAFAALLLWGSPAVVVNTSGGDLNAAKGFPWQRGDANSFVQELHKQLFAKTN